MTTRPKPAERVLAAAARSPHARVIAVPPPQAAAEDTDTADGSDAPPTPTTAELWLYGTVGGYWWGFNSDDVADALRTLGDVDSITVRLHSFGGSAIDGIAIANLLANHPARVRVVVDGIAASAATQIALAGDELIMSPGTQFMVHDAWMYTAGNAAELRAEADWLDKQSANYAQTYAARAGGTEAEWRERMTADNGEGTWYTAAEAVEAGIANAVENIASTTVPPAMPDPEEFDDLDSDAAAAAAYDLEVLLAPAARAAMTRWHPASTHQPPAASAPGTTHTRTQKETAMAFTPEQLTQMRQDLGLAETADEATIVAALSEALAEQADDAPAATTTGTPEGTTLVSTEVLQTLQAQAREGAEARAQQRTESRDRAIEAAVAEGRIAPAQREHFTKLYDADATGTQALLAQLSPGLVPVAEIGHDQPPAEGTHATVDDDALEAYAASMGLTAEDLR